MHGTTGRGRENVRRVWRSIRTGLITSKTSMKIKSSSDIHIQESRLAMCMTHPHQHTCVCVIYIYIRRTSTNSINCPTPSLQIVLDRCNILRVL